MRSVWLLILLCFPAVPAGAPSFEPDEQRYVTEKDLRVQTPGGGTICVLVVRPKGEAPLPALLQFTIYNDSAAIFSEARRAAAHGYAGVIGLTRGKGCSSDEIIPYEHDGADAAALIDWIAGQPWSDGQVGMYGGSYSGFTAWAAAKKHPRALKTIVVGAPNAPGIDSPMEGNVFWNFIYPWPFYTADNRTLDNQTYNDSARWERLNRSWYSSGRAYRDLEKIDGTPNPIFDRWLEHPAYDGYWRSLIPYKEEFAGIDMPILETAGYYFGGPGAAVSYVSQHYQYKPDARHYLLIGPYDHFTAQRGTATAQGDVDAIAGYTIDPIARIDLIALRFEWFDYVLKAGPKPAMLADKINYQVTGANVWKHAPSIAAMTDRTTRYFLSAGIADGTYRLSLAKPAGGSISLTVDYKDRRDADLQAPGGGVQDKSLNYANGLVFMSAPLTQATEMSGLFSGHLDFISNKKDFDFQVSLYELTPSGDYIQLAPYWSRASHAGDPARRQLLAVGKRQTVEFRSVRLMSRQLAAQSRLVTVLSIIKEPGRQINYGTGKDVSEETIADAKVPLNITWLAGSYIDVPTGRSF
jgi:putative CocE/NonD family hydrolase